MVEAVVTCISAGVDSVAAFILLDASCGIVTCFVSLAALAAASSGAWRRSAPDSAFRAINPVLRIFTGRRADRRILLERRILK